MNNYQNFTLKMTKQIVEVLDRNNIFYVICSGTLLGAIRHKGFIPWDDDIDIMLPVREYKRALKILKRELDSKYFVQNYHTEKKYNLPWTQIRANGTTSMPKKSINYDIHQGFCIDLFPVIGLYNNPKLRNIQLNLCRLEYTFLSSDFIKETGIESFGKQRLINKMPRLLRHIVVDFINIFVMRDNNRYDFCTAKDSGKCSVFYPKYIFQGRRKYLFEDTELYGIKDYDVYLSIVYGDYMKLPPEDKRCGHIDELGEIIFDLNKDYRLYRNC